MRAYNNVHTLNAVVCQTVDGLPWRRFILLAVRSSDGVVDEKMRSWLELPSAHVHHLEVARLSDHSSRELIQHMPGWMWIQLWPQYRAFGAEHRVHRLWFRVYTLLCV